jgi:hypothetical protein
VFLCLTATISDRILEKRVTLIFCAQLEMNSNGTSVTLSEIHEEEAMKMSSASELRKQFK